MGILSLVSFWGIYDHSRRQARLEWTRPLDVAIVLTQQQPIKPSTIRAFRNRIPLLEQQLKREFSRYRDAGMPPIRFFVYGPITAPPPPAPMTDNGLLDRVVDGVARRVYAERINRIAETPLIGFDSRIYLELHPPSDASFRFVEGFSEQGGRHGFVSVQLDGEMIDFALFVAVHELFHTLGATDKYDDSGRTMLPFGLADPTQQPQFPQLRADVMAHGRPVAPGVDDLPDSLDELGVGPSTARELRWLPVAQ